MERMTVGAGESLHGTRLPDARQSAQRGDLGGSQEAIVAGSEVGGLPLCPGDSKVGPVQRVY